MNIYGIIAIFAGLALFVGFMLWYRNKKRAGEVWKRNAFDRTMYIMESVDPVSTPAGVPVYFESDSSKSAFNFSAADKGIENTYKKLICAGYPVDPARYKPIIIVFDSELSPESRTPSFRVFIGPHSQWTNSPWDMATCPDESCDHYILASGELVAVGEPFGDIIAIANPQGDVEFNERIVEFEWEHVGYAHEDGTKFEETKTHGIGAGHPIIPACPEDASFASHRLAPDVLCLPANPKGSVVK